jgi:hypothetical protein
MNTYDVDTFEEFWPHYVRMHTRSETHLLHAVATILFAVLAGLAFLLWSPFLLILAPVADYTIAQASHRFIEGNATTPWKHPIWHARAELAMLWLVCTGRMRDEVARHAADAV